MRQNHIISTIKNGSVLLKISGLVQGVGFRPFIYRIAHRHHINGWVENATSGVQIRAEGKPRDVSDFIQSIKEYAPPASFVDHIEIIEREDESYNDFHIRSSADESEQVTRVSPDIAVCHECLEDMQVQQHRIHYPFINCTNCGPRFSIIKDLPYDRDKTTMDVFEMCDVCRKEYEDVLDRRFHAQPVACNHCGPVYRLVHDGSEYHQIEDIILKMVTLISDGAIISVKGTGGYFITCDARNENTVSRLRNSKQRDGKPFAVMFPDIDSVKEYTLTDEFGYHVLESWRRPVVLLKQKKELAKSINPNIHTLGAMLPYMPIHYLLFQHIDFPVVFTSGNLSEIPIIIDDHVAENALSGISDAILTYNRQIHNRLDDSVVMTVNGRELMLRRSRGYVPNPVKLNIPVNGIVATGAELVNCFAIGKGRDAILSQHIGDLKNIETYEFFTGSMELFKQLFRVNPVQMVCDAHPDYLSTRFARESGLPVMEVQHHHAHVASCMAENMLREKVIGIALDGTGYGDDGNIWGGEFLLADLTSYQRYSHFEYIPVPGGDQAIKEPWRTALSYLYKIYGRELTMLNIPLLNHVQPGQFQLIINAIDKKINCPLSSSAGRLFDAVSAITGICTRSTFHADAPMRLEHAAEEHITDSYSYKNAGEIIAFDETIKLIVEDLDFGIPRGVISAKFHNTVIDVIVDKAMEMRDETGINDVVLSGGTFQNCYLSEHAENELIKNEFNVFTHCQVPMNDGGIALGQMAIAGSRIEKELI